MTKEEVGPPTSAYIVGGNKPPTTSKGEERESVRRSGRGGGWRTEGRRRG